MTPQRVLAGIGLGANLGSPESQVALGFAALAELPFSEVVARSRCYRSVAIGPAGQADYCNAAALIATELAAEDLLRALQGIEDQAGRRRDVPRWGPRHLDLDILFYGEALLTTERLWLPHPELARRNFVLTPLAEIAPSVSIRGLGVVADLAAALPQDGLSLWA